MKIVLSLILAICHYARGAQIKLASNEFCVDLPGGDITNGNVIWLWECGDWDSQQWLIGDGVIRYAAQPDKCIDVVGGADGTIPEPIINPYLQIWDCLDGAVNQNFVQDGSRFRSGDTIPWHKSGPELCIEYFWPYFEDVPPTKNGEILETGPGCGSRNQEFEITNATVVV